MAIIGEDTVGEDTVSVDIGSVERGSAVGSSLQAGNDPVQSLLGPYLRVEPRTKSNIGCNSKLCMHNVLLRLNRMLLLHKQHLVTSHYRF
jgi:hypothetical protein